MVVTDEVNLIAICLRLERDTGELRDFSVDPDMNPPAR
jgi:hypothetical protein